MVSRFQFSLAGLLLAMTAIATPLAVLVHEPCWQTGILITFFIMAIPAILLSGVLHTTGFWRAWCIGAMVPALTGLFAFSLRLYTFLYHGQQADAWREAGEGIAENARLPMAFIWGSMLPIGSLSAITAWLLGRRRQDRDTDGQSP